VRVALLSRAAYPLHSPGGLERAVYHLAKHLGLRGCETVLLTRPRTRDPGDGTDDFPGTVVTLPYGRLWGVPHGRTLDRVLHYPAFAMRLGGAVAEMVREGQIDLVHAQGLTALGYGRARARDPSLRAPLIMNPQGMEEHKAQGIKAVALGRIRSLSREAARLADRVIATDECTREEVPRYLGVDPDRVVVLPNGIDPGEIDAVTPPPGAPEVTRLVPSASQPLFLSVGRLLAYKGFGDILKAFVLADRRGGLPPRWAWIVAGEGPYRQPLQREAGAWLGKHVHLVGAVSERQLHGLYAGADVFVHAPRFEGSSLVTLEAMAHGVVVLATRAGGIPDKVVPGETGFLVAPGDVGELAHHLERLGADPGERQRLGANGRVRARSRFAWSRIADATLALYHELIAAKAGAPGPRPQRPREDQGSGEGDHGF